MKDDYELAKIDLEAALSKLEYLRERKQTAANAAACGFASLSQAARIGQKIVKLEQKIKQQEFEVGRRKIILGSFGMVE